MKLRLTVLPVVVMIMALTFACPAGAQQKVPHLSWQAPTSSPSGITVTGYKVYRGTASGAEGTTAYATVTSASVTTFVDANVTPGTSYFYKVTATGTCDPTKFDCSTNYTLVGGVWVGESAASNEASTGAIPLPSAPAIGAPTAATAVVQ